MLYNIIMIKKEKIIHNNQLIMVILGQLFTLAFISGLEFVSPIDTLWLFILLLIGMHLGIVLFILSKKIYKKDKNFSLYYNIFYIMLIPFLILMGVKIAKIDINPTLEYGLVFSYIGIVLIVSIIIDVLFYKKIKNIKTTYSDNT